MNIAVKITSTTPMGGETRNPQRQLPNAEATSDPTIKPSALIDRDRDRGYGERVWRVRRNRRLRSDGDGQIEDSKHLCALLVRIAAL